MERREVNPSTGKTSILKAGTPVEYLEYPFCDECHAKAWKNAASGTNFVQTANIRPVSDDDDDVTFLRAIALGELNDPILDSVG
jgi:hypothetical protein